MSIPEGFLQAINQARIPQFKYFESIGSTNQVALEWLETGAIDQAIVFSDHQSAGRGRFNRPWVTEPGSALALSIIVKPSIEEMKSLSLFSPLAGVALTDVLKNQYHIEAQIKWPNDVLIKRMKTSGILTETTWSGEKMSGLVVGIGVNLLPASIPPKKSLKYPATCVQNHCLEPINRYDFLKHLLKAFSNWRSLINNDKFLNQWQKLLAFRGEKVYIKRKDGSVQLSGWLHGLTPMGDLEILTEDNRIETITVGDVHLRPAEEEN